MKVSEMGNDEIIKLVVQIRDQLSVEQKAFETRKSALKEKIEKLSGVILARYREAGIESARTQYGTAYKETVGYGNIADKEIVRQMILEDENAWELVTLLPNKAGIRQYIEDKGDVPPGFNWREEIELRVRRS